MIQTNLILIDGIPGAGKSTSAQALCMHLQNLGVDVNWFHEYDVGHPIYNLAQHAQLRETGLLPEGFWRDVSDRWNNLSKTLLESGRVIILESTLFQIGVGLMQLMGFGENDIRAREFDFIQSVARLNPVVIYLGQPNAAQALDRISRRKHGEWSSELIGLLARTPYGKTSGLSDLEGLTAFYEAQQRLSLSILNDLPVRKLVLDVSGGAWNFYRGKIAEFLSIPEFNEAPPEESVANAGMAGRYRDIKSSDIISIGRDAAGLYFDDPSQWRLRPKTGNTYYVESVCLEVSFEKDAGGSVRQLRMSGPLPNLSELWVRIP